MSNEKQVQNKTTILIVAFFLGSMGIHRLMMGHSNWWLMLLTFGGCGIWTLIDIVNIATGNLKMKDGRELEK